MDAADLLGFEGFEDGGNGRRVDGAGLWRWGRLLDGEQVGDGVLC